MALRLEKNLTDNFNEVITFPDCYVYVANVTGSKHHVSASVHFCRNEEKDVLIREFYDFVPSMEGPNYIKQAYLHLKTLPEFEGAVDC